MALKVTFIFKKALFVASTKRYCCFFKQARVLLGIGKLRSLCHSVSISFSAACLPRNARLCDWNPPQGLKPRLHAISSNHVIYLLFPASRWNTLRSLRPQASRTLILGLILYFKVCYPFSMANLRSLPCNENLTSSSSEFEDGFVPNEDCDLSPPASKKRKRHWVQTSKAFARVPLWNWGIRQHTSGRRTL